MSSQKDSKEALWWVYLTCAWQAPGVQLRGRRARAAHSITAVAIAFHATRRRAASGSAPLGGPTRYRVGSDRPLPGTRQFRIRRGGPAAVPPPTQPRPGRARLASRRPFADVPPSVGAAVLSCCPCPSAGVAVLCSAWPMCLRLCKCPALLINAPVWSPILLHQASSFMHAIEPRAAAVCR